MKALFKPHRPLGAAALRRRLKRIRLFAMDIDGVLTEGDILVLESGEEIKIWNVKDRIGLFMLKKFGDRFPVAWITGRRSPQVETRSREIGVSALRQHCEDKGRALVDICASLGVSLDESLFIGDDLVDLPALRRAGLAICPADAHGAVRAVCHWVTRAPGGKGAVREVIDAVLDAQGVLAPLLEKFENPERRPTL